MHKHLALTLILSTLSATTLAQTTQIVKIGSGAPTSGGIGYLGQDNELGAQLAVNDINAKGLMINGQKIVLELVGEDDAGDARQGVTVAQKIVDSGAVAVVGHLNSGVSIPANKIYAKHNMVQVSPSSTNPQYTLGRPNLTQQGHRTAYRLVAFDIQQGKMLAKWMQQKQAKRVAVLDDSTQYGYGLANYVADALDDNQIKTTVREPLTDKTTDFKGVLTQIKKTNADYIFWGGMDDTGAILAKQMKQLGLKAKLLGGDGVCTNRFIELAGKAGKGMVCSQAGAPLANLPRGAWFRTHFAQQSGREVEIYAPFAYDAVYAIVEAMKIAQSTEREAIAKAMPKVDFEGITGRIRFDKNGDIQNGPVTMSRVVNGRLVVDEVLR
ncbi:MAG: branched-chain amino acid ABC transporter substrate-binding protein [Formosimonas sp.]